MSFAHLSTRSNGTRVTVRVGVGRAGGEGQEPISKTISSISSFGTTSSLVLKRFIFFRDDAVYNLSRAPLRFLGYDNFILYYPES